MRSWQEEYKFWERLWRVGPSLDKGLVFEILNPSTKTVRTEYKSKNDQVMLGELYLCLPLEFTTLDFRYLPQVQMGRRICEGKIKENAHSSSAS
jgi:hypothetical protein